MWIYRLLLYLWISLLLILLLLLQLILLLLLLLILLGVVGGLSLRSSRSLSSTRHLNACCPLFAK